jgi:predicted ATPase
VAQIGAAIGREFSHPLLASVVGKAEKEVASALDRLIIAGLLFRQGMPPEATYLFKHALVQDAAYGTLLREPRRALHARIAENPKKSRIDIVQATGSVRLLLKNRGCFKPPAGSTCRQKKSHFMRITCSWS